MSWQAISGPVGMAGEPDIADEGIMFCAIADGMVTDSRMLKNQAEFEVKVFMIAELMNGSV